MSEQRLCDAKGCEEAATCGVLTQRPTRANLWTKVWWAEGEAPKKAQRYCPQHTAKLLTDLAKVLA